MKPDDLQVRMEIFMGLCCCSITFSVIVVAAVIAVIVFTVITGS